MCGISGFIDFTKKSDFSDLKKMNDTLFHRGPDGEGMEIYNTQNAIIGFGHRRLSIIDLSEGGSQPMKFKNLHIVFNGEIYNYKEIRNELAQKGHVFTSYSDTEVVLHAFETWGLSCIHKFIGMFAIVLHDELNNKVYFIRDRAGVKPLYYYWKNDIMLFASELKAIVAHPQFEKELNIDAIGSFLQFGYVPSPHCIYKHTFKINPGHYIFQNLSTKEIEEYQYWNVYSSYNKKELKINFEDAKLETEKLLKEACNYRMVADVPVGIFLSGGYDSTIVTALLQKDRTEKLKTFTIGFEDQKLNEAHYAKEIAKHLGTDHTEYYCTEKEALDIVPQLSFFYDEPFADSSAIPTTLVSKIASKKVTVALSADAGDEIFAGYNRYDYILKFGNKVKKIPAPLRKTTAMLLDMINADSIPILKNKYLFHSRYEKVKQFLKHANDESMNQILSKQFLPDDVSKLLKQPIVKLASAFDSKELNDERYSTLNYIMAIDYQTYLVDDILQKVDRATMANSLEGREPFLDHRIIEWAAQLPMEFKYNNGIKKFILREIAHQYVPKEMLDRPKMGFGVPIAQWLKNDLKCYIDQYFNNDYLLKQNIFNISEVNKVIKGFYDGKKERAEKVWYLLVFQMWYDKWING
jgi:asparagine synthase (glutamine-hydrolysing)